VEVPRFPDGESLVRIRPPARACAVLVRSLHHPVAKPVETRLPVNALRRAGARQVILVAPYLPYMRQDKVFTPGEPISPQVIGECRGRTFDRVLTKESRLWTWLWSMLSSRRVHLLASGLSVSARLLPVTRFRIRRMQSAPHLSLPPPSRRFYHE
jgi:hypothetical protein